MIFDLVYGIPEDLESLGMITYSICEDGMYLIRKAGSGSIVTKVEGIPGTGKGAPNAFNTILPRKIPFSVYQETVKFFRAVISKFGDKSLEAFVLVLHNPQTDDFKMYVPRHSVTGGSVKYDLKEVWDENPGYYLVLDIHSHHDMGAYFSGTDDKDDNRDRYSAVIGKLSGLIPEFVVRFSTLGKHFDSTLEAVFEDTDEILTLDIEEALAKIEYVKPTVGWTMRGSSVTGRRTGLNHLGGYGISNKLYGGFSNLAREGGEIGDLTGNSGFWDDYDEEDAR